MNRVRRTVRDELVISLYIIIYIKMRSEMQAPRGIFFSPCINNALSGGRYYNKVRIEELAHCDRPRLERGVFAAPVRLV